MKKSVNEIKAMICTSETMKAKEIINIHLLNDDRDDQELPTTSFLVVTVIKSDICGDIPYIYRACYYHDNDSICFSIFKMSTDVEWD